MSRGEADHASLAGLTKGDGKGRDVVLVLAEKSPGWGWGSVGTPARRVVTLFCVSFVHLNLSPQDPSEKPGARVPALVQTGPNGKARELRV